MLLYFVYKVYITKSKVLTKQHIIYTYFGYIIGGITVCLLVKSVLQKNSQQQLHHLVKIRQKQQ